MNKNADQDLYQVFNTLHQSVLNDEGYGGPVHHKAWIQGWELMISQSDFGDVLLSARQEKENEEDIVYGWELLPDDSWAPILKGMEDKREEFEEIVKLAKEADWQDLIERQN